MTNRRFKVVLDSGHGGRDPGAVGPTGLKEKDVTLAVARRAASLLAPLVDVQLTRDTDTDFAPKDQPYSVNMDIGHRAREIVNKSGANVCVSIHCNSLSTRPEAHGVETWYHEGTAVSVRNKALAAAVQRKIAEYTGRANRGVKVGTFGMIRIPIMPSALVEMPFISNPQEEVLLRDPAFQDKCARAIAEGILNFLGIAGLLTEPADGAATASKITVKFNGRPTSIPTRITDGRTEVLLSGHWVQLRALIELIPSAEIPPGVQGWNPETKTVNILVP